MRHEPATIFAFAEPDHLIRIHVRLQLEDTGFRVEETGDDLRILDPAAELAREACGETGAG